MGLSLGKQHDLSSEIPKTQIVIIAGGKAKRLGLDIQKCMLEISGRRLIDICIDSLAAQGFTNIAVLAGHKSEEVVSHVSSTYGGRMHMSFSVDPPSPGGWGKGKAFKTALQGGAVDRSIRSIVVFPDDIILEEGIHLKLLSHHLMSSEKFGTNASLVLVPEIALDYGIAEVDKNDVVSSFREKPLVPYSASVGIYLFEPAVYEAIESSIDLRDESPVDLESTVLPILVRRRQLSALYIARDKWLPVNTLKEFENAKKVLSLRQ
jgi:NDP-sugar pyrophosphorylase family protein